MQINTPILFIEIKDTKYIFVAGKNKEDGDFKLIYKKYIQTEGISNNKIINFEIAYETLKKNIYLIEQELNFTFKETILILNDCEGSFLNFTGFKKLNGSQLKK